ncbi:MAG TPA: hypothetical protein VKZ53_07895 [Candidatus Angelobacter sp.]|nr:hypothetical protein [Candidatus Angelobacter sp.]
MPFRSLLSYFLAFAFYASSYVFPAASMGRTPMTAKEMPQSGQSAKGGDTAARDGQHDFDFDFGTWKTHSRRLLHPLTGSTTWADMDGTTVVKKIWDGRANIAEYKGDGPAGHVELLSLRWYNPDSHQWSLDFATPNAGTLGIPNVGEFKNGRGDFYDQEEMNGRSIMVRFSIWGISADKAQSEQAFSADGGKTWETNWINHYTRISNQTEIDWSQPSSVLNAAGAQDFGFKVGTFHTQISRTIDPFANPSNPSKSIALAGTVSVRNVWGGRAKLEEIETDGPNGHWEALTLFLYNPQSHQWSQNFINSKRGVLATPLIGSFKDGRAEMVSTDTYQGKSILVRGMWSDITPNTHRYEEAYSDDVGKTWLTAFSANLTRIKE